MNVCNMVVLDTYCKFEIQTCFFSLRKQATLVTDVTVENSYHTEEPQEGKTARQKNAAY